MTKPLKTESNIVEGRTILKIRKGLVLTVVLPFIVTEQGKVLNTVECFDFKEKRWSYTAPMIIARKMVGSAILDGQLYAVGGVNNDYADLVTVECYSPCTGQWTSVASLDKCKGKIIPVLVTIKSFSVKAIVTRAVSVNDT